jgi:hypothetical protein
MNIQWIFMVSQNEIIHCFKRGEKGNICQIDQSIFIWNNVKHYDLCHCINLSHKEQDISDVNDSYLFFFSFLQILSNKFGNRNLGKMVIHRFYSFLMRIYSFLCSCSNFSMMLLSIYTSPFRFLIQIFKKKKTIRNYSIIQFV